MGKTKTAFVAGTEETAVTGEKKYKERLKKKAADVEAMAAKGTTKIPEKVHISGLKGGQRIKAVIAEPIPSEAEISEVKAKKEKKAKFRGKKYQAARAKIDKSKLYSIPNAIKLVKDTSYSSFDGTMELHLITKKDGISVNVTLPHSSGRKKVVEVANDKTIEKLEAGKIDFDVLLATVDMMPKLVPFARILGPRGLMPNPKNGTLIKKAGDTDKFSGNMVTIKTQKDAPLIHAVAGKVSQPDKELAENIETILEGIGKKQILKAYIKSTMSPSIKLVLS